MFGRKKCRHDLHTIRCFLDTTIRRMANEPDFAPGNENEGKYYEKGDVTYSETVCLKCGEYKDRITPRYEHHLQEKVRERLREAEIKRALARLDKTPKLWQADRRSSEAVFKAGAIKKVEDYLKSTKTAAKIDTISQVYEIECEWCSNRSRAITFSFRKESCCVGSMTVFEDESFGPQSEWFVCNRCGN